MSRKQSRAAKSNTAEFSTAELSTADISAPRVSKSQRMNHRSTAGGGYSILAICLAAVLAMLASLLTFAGPAANPTSAQTTFTPTIEIAVPLDGGEDMSIYSGLELKVSIENSQLFGGIDPAMGCTTFDEQLTFTLGDDAGAAGDFTGTVPSLVDRPAGVTSGRCVYALVWQEVVSCAASITPPCELRRSFPSPGPGGKVFVNDPVTDADLADSRVAEVDYVMEFIPPWGVALATNYNADDDPTTPMVDESMADGSPKSAFAGAEIRVAYEEDCSHRTMRYFVQNDGTVQLSTKRSEGKLLGSDAPDQTSGGIEFGGDECRYTQSFAGGERGGSRLVRQGPHRPRGARSVTWKTAPFTVMYDTAQSNFEPSRWTFFEIPFVDSEGDSQNDLAGTHITVEYNPIANPAQHADCTSETATEIHTIGTGGSASEGGVVSFTGTNTPAELVDRRAGQTDRCRYTADYQDSFMVGTKTYELEPADDNIEIIGASHPDPTYILSNRFDADITINVPDYPDDSDSSLNYFNGAEFMVGFAPPTSPANCTPAFSHPYAVSDSRTAAPTGGAPELIDIPRMPVGETASCIYTVSFPAAESPDPGVAATPAWTLNRQEAATATLQRDGSITRSYLATETSFTPTAAFAVPGIVHLSNPSTNLFAGLEFELAIADGTGVTDGTGATRCSTNIASLTFTVQPGSSVTLPADTDLPTLIDRPAEQDSRCSYAITTPAQKTSADDAASVSDAALTWTLTRQSGHTESIGAAMSDITVAYDTSEDDVTFEPEVAIGVPQYDQDAAAGTNWFAGETFDVEFDKSAGPASGCTPDNTEFTWTVQADGTVTSADDTKLVGYPSSQTAACEYAVIYPANEEGGTRLARIAMGLDTATQANDRATAATYHGETSFVSSVTIAVPFVDGDSNDQNDLAGQQITVTFVPAAGSDEGCSGAGQSGAEADATETYTIAMGGSVAAGGSVEGPGAAASLVDRPAGVIARCNYVTDFNNAVGTQATGMFELVQGDGASVSATSAAVAARYTGDILFEIALDISVPQYERDGAAGTNYFEGATFEIEYAPVGGGSGGCSPANSKTYVVQATGAVEPFGGAFKLVDTPEGQTNNCAYTLSFPEDEPSESPDPSEPDATPAWVLERQGTDSAATARVSAAAASASVSYLAGVIWFAPMITATVPDVEGGAPGAGGAPGTGGAAGDSAFAGASFTVSLRQRTVEGLDPADCSAATELQLTFTVAADGEVSGAVPERLVDRPAHSDVRCEYVVGFPESVLPPEGAELTWVLSRPSNAGTSLSGDAAGGAASATSAYTVGDVSFVPDVSISVPPYNRDDNPDTPADESRQSAFAGTAFAVSFGDGTNAADGSALTGCSTSIADASFVVQPGGSVAAPAAASLGASPTPGTAPTLVDRPAGAAARCTYAVSFSASETGGNVLALQAGSTASVSATAQAATASYLTRADSLLAAIVVITVDMLDADRNQAHDLSGVLIELEFARVSGAHASCTASASQSYAVADDGTVALAQPPLVAQVQSLVMLVDRPAGRNERCQYDMSYPASLSHPDTPDRAALVLARGSGAGGGAGSSVGSSVGSSATTRIDGGDRLTLAYGEPPRPSSVVQPVPLMSVNTQAARLPVRVAVDVPVGDFSAGETFEVLVSVPGACGSDTFLFGGVPASAGVAYAADATARGEVVLLGEGTLFVNPRASYSLPPYVEVAAAGAASAAGSGAASAAPTREPCSIRVTALSPPECSLSNPAGTDSRGRSYIQTTWAPGATTFDLTASYSCQSAADRPAPAPQAQIALTQGWVTLPFNGPTGTTPAEFLRLLGGAVSSMWVWDADSQSWHGWSARHGSLGLTSLTRGDTIMAYAHIDVTITYSPADLLALPEPVGRLALAPGFNLHTWSGGRDGSGGSDASRGSPANLATLLRQPSPVAVVFLWHVPTQSWRYHLPGRQPIASLEIPWFDTLSPGDTVFIYNATSRPATIAWA